MRAPNSADSPVVETDIPARLDRLPWGRFHTLVVVALGITWILDGLEVTLAGTVAGALKQSPVLQFSNADVGLAGSAYLAGAVLGALFFGWLTDRLGRKKLFFITLTVYLVATAATAFSWNLWSFLLFRFITGAGIGGEYAAINSTIQELIPARVRGWTDLVINGSFWIGAALGALAAIVLLDPAVIDPEHGWRVAFLSGAVLAGIVFFMRLWLPESPRWLMTHGRAEEAEKVVAGIEQRIRAEGHAIPDVPLAKVRLRTRTHTPLTDVVHTLIHRHRDRTLVALALMAAQAFFYNAIFFTYALVLTTFYGIPSQHVGWYILPFAAGNVLGPLLLGRHHRAAPDDRVHLPDVGAAAGADRVAVRQRDAQRARADFCLERDLLFRLRGGERGLSDRERDVPAGNSRARDRGVLRGGDRRRRRRGPGAVRRADRYRLTHEPVRRISARRRADDRSGRRDVALGRGGGAQAAGDGRPAAGVYRLTVIRCCHPGRA
jgi:MFS family permease